MASYKLFEDNREVRSASVTVRLTTWAAPTWIPTSGVIVTMVKLQRNLLALGPSCEAASMSKGNTEPFKSYIKGFLRGVQRFRHGLVSHDPPHGTPQWP